jgi:hypothetical protein
MKTRAPDAFGCTRFVGKLDRDGYGRVGLRQAHIVAWEDAFGPVPEGFVLDHLCKVRSCVALHHLEAVTQSENLYRRAWSYQSRRKECPKGHALRDHGIVTEAGGKVCLLCNREAARG